MTRRIKMDLTISNINEKDFSLILGLVTNAISNAHYNAHFVKKDDKLSIKIKNRKFELIED